DYNPESDNWKINREYAEYTSSSIHTRGSQEWEYGYFEIRARIDTSRGSWPAIWTLGRSGEWPSNGEIDIMEFYRKSSTPTILANFAWGTEERWVAEWDGSSTPLSEFLSEDPEWPDKFHVWSMDWNQDRITLSIDGEVLNETDLSQTTNPDGSNPFKQPHYILLNLALGSNGGDPSQSEFPMSYEVDYVRVYQYSDTIIDCIPDTFYTVENTDLSTEPPGVMGNDGFSPSAEVTASIVTPPEHGSLDFNSDGSFTYTPEPDFSGEAVFSYELTGDQGGSDIASATIEVMKTPVTESGKTYYIESRNTGNFISANDNAENNPKGVLSEESESVLWKLSYQGQGYYSVIRNGTQNGLDCSDEGTSNGTPLLIYEFNDQPNQLWRLRHHEGEWYTLTPKHTDRYIHSEDGRTSPGTPLILDEPVAAEESLWRFVDPEGTPVYSSSERPGASQVKEIKLGRRGLVLSLNTSKEITLSLYTLRGRSLIDRKLHKINRGRVSISLDSPLSSGIYRLRIRDGNTTLVNRTLPLIR
ncbi:MAG: RICIN domain-containing protein, partial [Chitinivibrionales bacterium]